MTDNWELVEAGNQLPITCDISKLTYMELKLLLLMLDPETISWTNVQRCEAVGCHRDTLWRAMKKPAYREAKMQMTNFLIGQAVDAVKEHVPALLESAVKHAHGGSFQHWKEIMIIGGVIQPAGVAGESGEITIRFADPRAAPAIDIAPSE